MSDAMEIDLPSGTKRKAEDDLDESRAPRRIRVSRTFSLT